MIRSLLALALAACVAIAQDPDEARGQWPSFGRDDAETRFSPLDQIDAGNAKMLGLAWSLDKADSLPLMVDDVLYGTVDGAVYAADAKTGALKWQWEGGGRALALWNGRVYAGQADGQAVALDAATGKALWTVGDRRTPVHAVRIVKDKLIVRSSDRITAYDAATGKGLWWVEAGPGPSLAYDAEIDVLYSGSIAVKPDTGNPVWQFRTTPQSLLLADLEIDKRARKTMVHLYRDGTAVVDRITGEEIHRGAMATGEGAASLHGGIVYAAVEGGVAAIDVAANAEKWRVTTVERGAAMATAGGLVFFGNAAYDAATGARVWREPRLRGVTASMTYMLGGRQYVAMLAQGRLFVLTLDGEAPWP